MKNQNDYIEIEIILKETMLKLSGKNTYDIICVLKRFLEQVTLQSTLKDDCQFL